jgi:hypothetical protein
MLVEMETDSCAAVGCSFPVDRGLAFVWEVAVGKICEG